MAYVNTTFLPKTSGMVFGERLEARAEKGRVFLMAGTPAPDALTVVTDAVLTGDPYVGSKVTCTNPVVSGGLEPYSYDYMWLDTRVRSDINNTTLLEYDKGKNVSCYVTVVSADGQTVHSTSNAIGPVVYQPSAVVLTQELENSYEVSIGGRVQLQVGATGVHSIEYAWQFRKADDSGWVAATSANLNTEFPDAETLLFEVNEDNEPLVSTFMLTFFAGPGPSKFRCRVRDVDPDGNYDQKLSQTTLNYV